MGIADQATARFDEMENRELEALQDRRVAELARIAAQRDLDEQAARAAKEGR